MSSIVWLASYPKSGNTWLRALLANYLTNAPAPVAINDLPRFSLSDNHVRPYVELSGKSEQALAAAEIHRLRPAVHRRLAESAEGRVFVKTHNAIAALDGVPLITPEVSACALYVVRNPLDVLPSFADHYGLTIERAIAALNNPRNVTLPQPGVTFQLLSSWSIHVTSWLDSAPFPIHALRYEDLAEAPEATFSGALGFLGLEPEPERVGRAIAHSRFSELARQEDERGFIERAKGARRFFRQGKAGGWRAALAAAQVKAVVAAHGEIMRRFGYLDAAGEPD